MKIRTVILLLLLVSFAAVASGQGTLADYERANGLQAKFQASAINLPGAMNWIPRTDHFWYRRTVIGGSEIVWVDAENLTRRPAFDHEKLAASLSSASGQKYTSLKLPLGGAANLTFVDSEQAIEWLSFKVGLVLLVLGGTHFFNMAMIAKLGYRLDQVIRRLRASNGGAAHAAGAVPAGRMLD